MCSCFVYKRLFYCIYNIGLGVCLLKNGVKVKISRNLYCLHSLSNNYLQMAAILRCYDDYITKQKFLAENVLCLHANIFIWLSDMACFSNIFTEISFHQLVT